jgi:hypothetical protein
MYVYVACMLRWMCAPCMYVNDMSFLIGLLPTHIKQKGTPLNASSMDKLRAQNYSYAYVSDFLIFSLESQQESIIILSRLRTGKSRQEPLSKMRSFGSLASQLRLPMSPHATRQPIATCCLPRRWPDFGMCICTDDSRRWRIYVWRCSSNWRNLLEWRTNKWCNILCICTSWHRRSCEHLRWWRWWRWPYMLWSH